MVYPNAGYDFNTKSYKKSAQTISLSTGLIQWFCNKYLRNVADEKSPLISLANADLKKLPATTIIGSQYGSLRSEGKILAPNLKFCGTTLNYKLFNGRNREFFGMGVLLPEAKEVQAIIAADLKNPAIINTVS